MKLCFAFLVALAMSSGTLAQMQTSISSGPRIEISVRVRVENKAKDDGKYSVKFLMTAKNRASTVHNFTKPVNSWSLKVYRENPDPSGQKQEEWSWIDKTPPLSSLAPGAEANATVEWETVTKDAVSYIVAAAFDGEVAAAKFVLQPHEMKADILFTGKLMGYYRVPNRQSVKDCRDSTSISGRVCENEDPDQNRNNTNPSPDAGIFFHHFGEWSEVPDDEIRLGMGDNFAPNYYSRAFDVSAAQTHRETEKYEYYWDTEDKYWTTSTNPTVLTNLNDIQSGHGTIPTDNVACFFLQAGYDAIVPGALDFYYGPERLRELARFLATPPLSGMEREKCFGSVATLTKIHPVQMLASNMVIKTTWAKGHEPVPDSAKRQLKFVTKYDSSKTELCPQEADAGCSLEVTSPSDGGFMFPWMQRVHITAKALHKRDQGTKRVEFNRGNVPEVFLCEAEGPVDQPHHPGVPDNFMNGAGKDCDNEPLYFERAELREDSEDTQELIYSFAHVGNPPRKLIPGHNYAICVVGHGKKQCEPGSKPDNRPYCVRFSVYIPFLQYPDWPLEEYDKENLHYNNPKLYVTKNDNDGDPDVKSGRTPVVIFGIVDPQLLEGVGADNAAWQTIVRDSKTGHWDNDYNTQVAIVDPVESLTQLQDYFDQEYCNNPLKKQYCKGDNHKVFRGIRVLMAQMSPARAKQLAARLPKRLRFDVILSEADDALATANQTVHIEPAVGPPCTLNDNQCNKKKTGLMNGALATPASFLVVPPTHSAEKDRHLQARWLSVTTDGASYWDYAVSGEPIGVQIEEPEWLAQPSGSFWESVCTSLAGEDKTKACNCDMKVGLTNESKKQCKVKNKNEDTKKAEDVPWTDADKATAIQQLALWSMRKRYKADIALLQESDFYLHGVEDYLVEHCTLREKDSLQCPIDVQQILERVIWKGDFLKIRSVTGSVLKAVMKESEQFAGREKKPYLHVSDAGRGLVKLGIGDDPNNSGEFLINSKPLDPNAIYTVATSDYIALGDTGYPELAKPAAGDPDPPAMPEGEVLRIATLACNEIQLESKHCDETISAKEYFDRAADRLPDDPREGNTNLRKFYAWMFLRPRLGQRLKPSPDDTPTAPEVRVNWEWSVDQLSLGLSGLSHTDSTERLSQEFGGVLNSQVNANRTHSWDWDAHSKLTFYHPKTDWFLEETLKYSSSFIAQLGAPRSETQSRNLTQLDGGTYLHLSPLSGKTLPQLSLVLSGHLEAAVAGPITTLALNAIPSSTTSMNLTFDQGRTVTLLGRSGLRWQNRKSYVEGGLEGGSTLNAIQQFDVVSSGGITVPCVLEASVSLTNCINNFNQSNPITPITGSSKVLVQRSPQNRYGAYWRIGMTVPINPVISFKFDDTSDYLFLSSGDNSADTRFRHDLVSTVKFMVLPNLSFEPTYTIFLYENKVDYNFLLQQQYSVKINYSFGFSNLHEWRRQFRYSKTSSP